MRSIVYLGAPALSSRLLSFHGGVPVVFTVGIISYFNWRYLVIWRYLIWRYLWEGATPFFISLFSSENAAEFIVVERFHVGAWGRHNSWCWAAPTKGSLLISLRVRCLLTCSAYESRSASVMLSYLSTCLVQESFFLVKRFFAVFYILIGCSHVIIAQGW